MMPIRSCRRLFQEGMRLAEKRQDILRKMITYFFTGVSFFLLVINIVYTRGYQSIGMSASLLFKLITLLAAAATIYVLIKFREPIVIVFGRIPAKLAVAVLLCISILLQFAALSLLNVTPSWDFGWVINGAHHLIEKGRLLDYYLRYPNNIFVTFVLALIGKLLMPKLIIYQVCNILAIVFSQYLIYRVTEKLAGAALGLICLLISVFFFPYIFYAPIVYTDTLSLLFLLIPANLLIDRNGQFRRHLTVIVLVSFLFSLCLLLKGTLIVFVVAYLLVLLLFLPRWRKLYCLLPVIIVMLVQILFNQGVNTSGIISRNELAQQRFPVTHWLMMGQNPWTYGKHTMHDVNWTRTMLKTESREQVEQVHLKEFRRRVLTRGWFGNIRFNLEKLNETWTDGTYYALFVLKRQPVRPNIIKHLTENPLVFFVQGYARIQSMILIFGVFLFALRMKKSDPILTLFVLAVIGFFLFLILWETRSRYLVSLTPFLIIMCGLGYFGQGSRPARQVADEIEIG